jgi:hypothetical protein
MIDTPLSDLIIAGKVVAGDKIVCDYQKNIFTFEKVPGTPSSTKQDIPTKADPLPKTDRKEGEKQRIEQLPSQASQA